MLNNFVEIKCIWMWKYSTNLRPGFHYEANSIQETFIGQLLYAKIYKATSVSKGFHYSNIMLELDKFLENKNLITSFCNREW